LGIAGKDDKARAIKMAPRETPPAEGAEKRPLFGQIFDFSRARCLPLGNNNDALMARPYTIGGFKKGNFRAQF
jgi:hypothetical protein